MPTDPTPAGLTARPEYCACGALLEQIAPHLYVCRQCRPFGPGTDQPRLWYGYPKTGQSSPVVYAFLAAHDALLRELSGVRHAASASAPDGVPPDGGLVRFVRWVVETWRARAEAAEARAEALAGAGAAFVAAFNRYCDEADGHGVEETATAWGAAVEAAAAFEAILAAPPGPEVEG